MRYRVCQLGTTAGWVGGPGEYYPPSMLLEEVPGTAKRAPEHLQGAEWVVPGAGRTGEYGDGGGDGPCTTPAGPGRSPCRCPPCTGTLRIAALQPIRARFQVISSKVSQNRLVSPKSV